MKKRTPQPPANRWQRLYEAQRGACWLCRGLMLRPKLSPTSEERAAYCTRDHVLPVSLGGKNVASNLLGAHAWCNHFRRSMPPDIAAKAIRDRLDNPQNDLERFIAGRASVQYTPPLPIPAWEQQGRKPSRAELLVQLERQRRAAQVAR